MKKLTKGKTPLKTAQVRAIYKAVHSAKNTETEAELAKRFRVSSATINNIKHGYTHSSITGHKPS